MCRALHEPLREAPTCGQQQGGDHLRHSSRSGGRREGKPRRCGWDEGATWRVIHRQQADLNDCSDLISLNLNFLEALLGFMVSLALALALTQFKVFLQKI